MYVICYFIPGNYRQTYKNRIPDGTSSSTKITLLGGIEDDPPFIYCCLPHGHRGNPVSDLKMTGLIKDTPDQSIDTLS